jgi:hypothetical protein
VLGHRLPSRRDGGAGAPRDALGLIQRDPAHDPAGDELRGRRELPDAIASTIPRRAREVRAPLHDASIVRTPRAAVLEVLDETVRHVAVLIELLLSIRVVADSHHVEIVEAAADIGVILPDR